MPCEGCQMQFTVFRRKRSCADCKRYYCSNCLTIGSPTKPNAQLAALCERCWIFARRPLLRNDLQHLKPKDLIFYLQSKHISTAGCVEKDELIGLVLNHVQEIDAHRQSSRAGNRGSGARSSADANNTSFRNLKQTCQNFFNNISENLQETFSAFDENNPKCNERSTTNATATTDQPRVSTRVLPSYASVQRNQSSPTTSSHSSNDVSMHEEQQSKFSNNNHVTTPTSTVVNNVSRYNRLEDMCLCSENEEESEMEKAKPSTTAAVGNAISEHKRVKINTEFEEENSSQSSFEELGAIGGLSDDSKTHADSNSGNSSNLEQWHIFDAPVVTATTTATTTTTISSSNAEQVNVETEAEEQATSSGNAVAAEATPQLHVSKKLLRHHSEGYLQLQRKWQQSLDDETPSTSGQGIKQRECCKRCGKHKTCLKQHIDRMRRQLESAQMSEADIKRELNEFLAYLESRTKSLDDEDSAEAISGADALSSVDHSALSFYDDNAGIHVYGNADFQIGDNFEQTERRFLSLNDFDSFKQLEGLSVKQLKELLMVNRVDYKGCVEKQELLDRVERLWKNLKSTPALEQLPTDELCKICMDAPIECVILECGHMATCTNCGKVLSECPICRQYIVRVVRFFRA